jgi:hypothetical protein
MTFAAHQTPLLNVARNAPAASARALGTLLLLIVP